MADDVVLGAPQFPNPDNTQVMDSDNPIPHLSGAVVNPIPSGSLPQVNPTVQARAGLTDRGAPRDLGNWANQHGELDSLMADKDVWGDEETNAQAMQQSKMREVIEDGHHVVQTPDGSRIAFPDTMEPEEMHGHVQTWWNKAMDKATIALGGAVNAIPGAGAALEASEKYYVQPMEKYLGKVGEAAKKSVQSPLASLPPKTQAYLRSQGVDPNGPMPEWAQGINEDTIQFAAQTVADPRMWPLFAESLATKAPGVARAVLGRALSGAVATQASAAAVAGVRDLVNNWDRMSPKDRAAAMTGTTLSTIMAGLTGYHAAVGSPVAPKAGDETPSYTGLERRAGDRKLMSPTEIDAAIKNRQPVQTPFDVTQGAMDTIARDTAMPKAPSAPVAAEPQPVAVNASGESAASQEAINRVASQRAQGIKTYRVDTRSGHAVPIIGVDAADATAGPYDHIVQVNNNGEVQIQDSGRGARPLDEQRLMRQVGPQTVGSAAGAAQDTALYQKAKAELGPDASPSDIAQRAQALKTGTPVPKRAAAAAGRSVGAASIDDLETKPDVPTFYSKAEQIINDKVSNNASGDSIKALLKNNGVKDDEMKWAGLDEFLKDKPKVSKAELQQFIKENQISLQDVDLGKTQRFTTRPNTAETAHAGEIMQDVIDPQNGLVRFTGTPEAAQDYISELGQGLSSNEQSELNDLKDENAFIDAENHRQSVDQIEALRAAREEHGTMSVEAKAAEKAINDSVILRGEERLNNHVRITELEAKAKQGATDRPTKYDKWTLPGERENYQEKLLTLPAREVPEVETAKTVYAKAAEERDRFLNGVNGGDGTVPPDVEQRFQEAQAALRALPQPHQGSYTAPHFSGIGEAGQNVPNIVAHVRFDDRPAVDGKKTLFMEEAQSDWHSAGRHEGYSGSPKEIEAAKQALQDAKDAKTALVQSVVDRVNATPYATPEEAAEHDALTQRMYTSRNNPLTAEEYEALQSRLKELKPKMDMNVQGPVKISPNSETMSKRIRKAMTSDELTQFDKLNADVSSKYQARQALQGNVPDAPFKQSWHELVMKRMLRQAAENGYDRLAWTTGDQQADLYDLTKHIGRIEYDPEQNELHAYDPSGKKVIDGESVEPTVEELSPYIGNELAKKLVSRIEDYEPQPSFDEEYAWQSARDNYSIDEREEPVEEPGVEEPGEVPERTDFNMYQAELAKKYGYDPNIVNTETAHRTPNFAQLLTELRAKLTPEEIAKGKELSTAAREAEQDQEDNRETETRYYVTSEGGEDFGPFYSQSDAEEEMETRMRRDVEFEAENYEQDKQDLPSIAGLDLRHGGEFHRLLYDQMIPSFLKKYAKKWGATVGTTEIKGMATPEVDYEGPTKTVAELKQIQNNGGIDGQEVMGHSQMQRLKAVIAAMVSRNLPFRDAMLDVGGDTDLQGLAEQLGGKFLKMPSNQKVHSIEITPAMRQSVMKEGQPIAKDEKKKKPFAAPQEPQVASNFRQRLSAKLVNQLA